VARLSDFLAELKRRRVIRALFGWGIASFAVLQVYESVMHGLHLPEWTLSFVVVTLGLGFPVTAALAWVFDLTASGIERTRPKVDSNDGAAEPLRSRRGRVALLLGLGMAAATPGLVYFFVWPGAARQPSGEAPAPGAAAAASIAVLPFADLSPDKDQDYFADGIAEEILNALAQIPGLRVVGRSSSFAFKGRSEDLSSVAQKLRVGTVLEGTVRKEGNRVRVTAHLVDATNGFGLWSQTFERDLNGIFAIQDEIAGAVVAALRGRLLAGAAPAPARRPTTIPEAYAKYLLGRHFINSWNREGTAAAVKALEESVSLDPRYAPAWASLAFALDWAANYEVTPQEAAALVARAREAADRAVALAPGVGDGYAVRGMLRLGRTWDWRGAEADMGRAVALGLTDATLIRLKARFVIAPQGRLSDSIADLQRAVETDPLSGGSWTALCRLLIYAERNEDAEVACRRCLEIAPRNVTGLANLSFLLALEGRGDEALATARANSDESWRLFSEAFALQALGRRAEADRALAEFKRRAAGTGAYQIASFHAWRGDRDEAFAWLDRALAQEDEGIADILLDPSLKGLRSDPRYRTILAAMNLPPDAVVR
jgi:TolB-like protein/Tfp pilus assembly protein PilF